MMPLAEVYVYEDDCTKQIGGFVGMNDNYIEGIFVKKAVQSKGIGKQLLNYAKEGKSTLRLSVYQKNKKAIRFYLREEFAIQSENIDNNTDEKEFVMVWSNTMDIDAKLRPLYLLQILQERTDEDNYLTTAQLASILKQRSGRHL